MNKIKIIWSYYVSIVILLLLDELTTLYGLSIGAIEANPLYLFIGFTFTLKLFIIILMFFVLKKLINIGEFFSPIIIGEFVLTIIYLLVIINNIIVILSL